MAIRSAAVALLFCLFSQVAAAETARHETLEEDRYGNPEAISVLYADDNGNIRMETYGIVSMATSSAAAGSEVDVTHSPGELQGLMVFQAAEEQMLVVDRGRCQILSADMEGMPGMPPGGMQEFGAQMGAAQQQMQEAMREMQAMAEQDPALARILEQQGAMIPGMPQQRPREMVVEATGDDRSFGNYDTTGFLVYEEGTERYRTSVWAADIDDVVGGRIVGSAMKGWLGLYRDVMERMGAGGAGESGVASAILDKMDDFYPIVTESDELRTTLTHAELGASADFYPDCG